MDLKIDFFEGIVWQIDQDFDNTRFEIIDNGGVIEVKNSGHMKFQISERQNELKLLTPVMFITVIRGTIPKNKIINYPISYYQELNREYTKDVPKDLISELYTLANYFNQQKFFSKQALDESFSFSKEDWIESASMWHDNKDRNVEIKVGEDDILITTIIMNIPVYSTLVMFDERTEKPHHITYTFVYPSGSLMDDQRDFYEKTLNQSQYSIPNSKYIVSSTYKQQNGIDILSHLVSG